MVAQLLVFGFMCVATPLQSVLVRFDCLKMPNGKKVFIFFEFHSPISARDKNQLEIMERILLLLNHEPRTDRLRLMVEVPAYIVQECAQMPKVTYDIINRVEHIQSIIAEDVEIRCMCLGASCLLDAPIEQVEDERIATELYNAGESWCAAGDITVERLLKEFSTQKAELCCNTDNVQLLEPLFRKKCSEIEADERRLMQVLQEVNARPDERIIDLARRLHYGSCPIMDLCHVGGKISDLGAHLFDLHILRKTLQSLQDNCMIITGSHHAEWLCEALECLGATYHTSESERLKVLDEEMLTYFEIDLDV